MTVKYIRWIFHKLAGSLAALGVLMLILRLDGIRPYMVLSGSMEPSIMAGGIVFTDTRERQPQPGDVITYQLNGTTVTHRVLRQEERGYITKGDANEMEDINPVLPSQIVGTVCFFLPFIGFLVSFLQTRTAVIGMIVLMLLAFFAESIAWIRNTEVSDKKRKKESAGK